MGNFLSRKIHAHTSLRQQLSITFAVAVLCLAAISALVTAHLASERLRDDQIERSEQITADFADRQSIRLALIYESAENASQAMQAILLQPDVSVVRVYRRNRQELLARTSDARADTEGWQPSPQADSKDWPESAAQLRNETTQEISFMAPVILADNAAVEFDSAAGGTHSTLLGYVLVSVSKKHLADMQARIFIDNISAALISAVLLLLLLQAIITRIARPLQNLHDGMQQASEGRLEVRAKPDGPKDIRRMGSAFNQMMEALDEREARLVQQNTALLREVSVRKQAEQMAELGATRLRSVIDNIGDGVITLGEDGLIESINPAACRLFGCDDGVIGQNLEVLMPPDYRPTHAGYVSAYLKNGAGQIVGRGPREMRGLRRDGTEFPIEVAVSEMRLGDQRLLIGIVRDITLRKETELTLVRARDSAVETARIKSEFLANMSHEIRTPMNGVLGMLELLRDAPITAEYRDYAETAYKSGYALLRLLNDILDFSKIEAGHLQIEQIPFDLREVVESAIETMAARAYAKGLAVGCQIDHDLPLELQGDPTRLTQILNNLIGNAVKFTESGEIFVNVIKTDDVTDGIGIRVEVTDTGCGIPLEAQSLVFDPFTQAEGGTTRRFGGTGLGLAVCKGLIDSMGGKLGVISEPEQGSLFWFTLRLGVDAAPVTVAPAPHPIGLKVLAVCWDRSQQQVLKRLLAGFGVQHELAIDGAQAISMVRRARKGGQGFDFVLFDTGYPETRGKLFIDNFAAEADLRNTRLVMLLPFGHGRTRAALSAAGLAPDMAWPMHYNQLVCHGLVDPVDHVKTPAPEAVTMPAARVLVVEDNPVNQMVIAGMLKRLGHQSVVAKDGQVALDLYAGGGIDIVIMDCQMPVMDGYQATRLIREYETACAMPRIPIIAMTANVMTGDREKCLAAGMDDFIAKPVEPEMLRACLAIYLPGGEKPGPAAVNAGKATPSLDLVYLHKVRKNLEEEFSGTVHIFLEDTPARIATMHAAFARGDHDLLSHMAHTLRGGSVSLGILRLAELCNKMEQDIRDGNTGTLEKSISGIELEYTLVAGLLEQELQLADQADDLSDR
jgi:PAS domain S-box-containing protein